MKVLAVTAVLGYLFGLGEAHCNNGMEPTVVGFGGSEPFSKPEDTDGCNDPIFCLISGNCCVEYDTDKTISFESYNSAGDPVDKTFKAEDSYSGAELTAFKELCEDLWILNDYVAQDSADAGGFNYNSIGLCFNTDRSYDPEFNSGRAQFIIDTCHGSEPSSAERLARLSDEVETTAAYAEDLARRQTFNTDVGVLSGQLEEAEDLWVGGDPNGEICNNDCSASATLCRELKMCYETQFGGVGGLFTDLLADTDVSVEKFINDSFMYAQCFNVTYQDLLGNKEGVCSPMSDTGCSPYDIKNGLGLCGEGVNPTEPVCPDGISGYFDSFTPAYPNPSDNLNYRDAVLTIQDLYLCKSGGSIDYTDRTSADAVGITLIVKIAVEGLKIGAELFKDSLPHWPLYAFKVVPFQIIAVVEHIVATVLEQTALQDGLVDGAEMEAVYENTLQLLKGSSSIYDEVVCRCTSAEQTGPLRGQGCDSIDNNCDDHVDECGEDTFKPEIDISDASLNCASGNGKTKWFTSNDDALECVKTFASVSDDCDTMVSFDSTTLSTATCAAATITLEASDRCGNLADTAVVPVFIDLVAPVVTCGLGANADKTIYIEDTGAGIMTDVQLLYDATDNCGFDMDVKVDVFANEIEDFHNQETAIFYRNGLWNDRVGMYIAAQYCVTNANGQCVKDPILDTRVYTVVVSAVDEAGNEAGIDECQVVILPNNKVAADFPTIPDSTQRFHLSTYTSTFTDYIVI